MISTEDSVDLAVEEIKDMWTKVWPKVDEGYMLYQDFKFATVDMFWKFQKGIKQDQTMHGIHFGSSYGPYPRVVRSYFPLFKDPYPLHHYNASHEELSVIVQRQEALRAKRRLQRQKKRLEEKDGPYVPL